MRAASVPVALATLFFFGCQTVQVRSVEVAGARPPLPVALAEPLLDLWVEGAGSVTPAETADALAASRAALGAALEGRGFVPEEQAGAVLVVQEQALARTEGRRSQQTGATVAIALLVVALVVLVAVAASQGHSRGPGPAGRPVARGVPAPGPGGFHGPPRPYRPPAPGFGWGLFIGMSLQVPPAQPPLRPPEPPTLEGRLASRGFFDGDETELVVELRDRQSGETIWSRRVGAEVDPRDPAAVRALLDRLVGGEPWLRAAPPPPAGPPAVPPGAPPAEPPPPPPAAPPAPPAPAPQAAERPGVAAAAGATWNPGFTGVFPAGSRP